MSDIRDSAKVASLPDDLKDIASQMLEEKFGLAKEGEVEEQRVPEETIDAWKQFDRYYEPRPLWMDDDSGRYRGFRSPYDRFPFDRWINVIRQRPYLKQFVDEAMYDHQSMQFKFTVYAERRPGRAYSFTVDLMALERVDQRSFASWLMDKFHRIQMELQDRVVAQPPIRRPDMMPYF